MEKRGKRNSILKPQKSRTPLEEVDMSITSKLDEDGDKRRRVSFSSSAFIKQFTADPEKNTIWDSTYEESMDASDQNPHKILSESEKVNKPDIHDGSQNKENLCQDENVNVICTIEMPKGEQEEQACEYMDESMDLTDVLGNNIVDIVPESCKSNLPPSLRNDCNEFETNFTTGVKTVSEDNSYNMDFTLPVTNRAIINQETENCRSSIETVKSNLPDMSFTQILVDKDQAIGDQENPPEYLNMSFTQVLETNIDTRRQMAKAKAADMSFTAVVRSLIKESSPQNKNITKEIENPIDTKSQVCYADMSMTTLIDSAVTSARNKNLQLETLMDITATADKEKLIQTALNNQVDNKLIENTIDTKSHVRYADMSMTTLIDSAVTSARNKNLQLETLMDITATADKENLLQTALNNKVDNKLIENPTDTKSHVRYADKSMTTVIDSAVASARNKNLQLETSVDITATADKENLIQTALNNQVDNKLIENPIDTNSHVCCADMNMTTAIDSAVASARNKNLQLETSMDITATADKENLIQTALNNKVESEADNMRTTMVNSSTIVDDVARCFDHHPNVSEESYRQDDIARSLNQSDSSLQTSNEAKNSSITGFLLQNTSPPVLMSRLDDVIINEPEEIPLFKSKTCFNNSFASMESTFKKLMDINEGKITKTREQTKRLDSLIAYQKQTSQRLKEMFSGKPDTREIPAEKKKTAAPLKGNEPEANSTDPVELEIRRCNESNTENGDWEYLSCELGAYKFYALYKSILLTVRLDEDKKYITSVYVQKKLNVEKSQARAIYCNSLCEKKLSFESLQAALGEKFDIPSLLDFVQITVRRLREIGYECIYLFNTYSVIMLRDFRMEFRIIEPNLPIHWIFYINLLHLDNITDETVTFQAKIGRINEKNIKTCRDVCPTGFSFVKAFVENVHALVDKMKINSF